MRVNQSTLRQVVFIIAAFFIDASVKRVHYVVSNLLVKLIPCRQNALTQLANIIDSILGRLFPSSLTQLYSPQHLKSRLVG